MELDAVLLILVQQERVDVGGSHEVIAEAAVPVEHVDRQALPTTVEGERELLVPTRVERIGAAVALVHRLLVQFELYVGIAETFKIIEGVQADFFLVSSYKALFAVVKTLFT